MQTCARCKEEKPSDSFIKNRSAKNGFSPYCKPCGVLNSQESRARNGWVPRVKIGRNEELRRKRRNRIMGRFGFSTEKAEEIMRLRESGVCEICGCPPGDSGRWKNLHLDHDHETGEPRGLICVGCNRAIGYLSDSAERAEKVANYLRDYGGKRA